MGAHPHAAARDLAQQRVELGAVAPLMNRIDPDEHTIERGKVCADGVEACFLLHALALGLGEREAELGHADGCFLFATADKKESLFLAAAQVAASGSQRSALFCASFSTATMARPAAGSAG